MTEQVSSPDLQCYHVDNLDTGRRVIWYRGTKVLEERGLVYLTLGNMFWIHGQNYRQMYNLYTRVSIMFVCLSVHLYDFRDICYWRSLWKCRKIQTLLQSANNMKTPVHDTCSPRNSATVSCSANCLSIVATVKEDICNMNTSGSSETTPKKHGVTF